MGYGESLLARDEQVLYRARQHWLAPVSDSLRPIVLVLAGLLLFIGQVNIGPSGTISTVWTAVWAILLLVGLGWIAIIGLTWRSQEYLITNRRVLKIEGLLDKKSADSSLEKINDALLSQGLLARLLKYGDLEILTANEEAIDRYVMLARAVDFKKAMLNAKNVLEDGGRFRPAPAAYAPTAPAAPAAAAPVAAGHQMTSDEVTTTLAKLAELRDKGAITPAEYESKKADLLGRI
jgi:uncharacterized membrane protein YdbT with pleckstrin-like domain